MWYRRTCCRKEQGRISVPGQELNIHEEYNYYPHDSGDKLVTTISSRECDLHVAVDSA